MPDIDELIAEVLRLDAEGTPGPWDSERWIDAGDTTAYGVGRRDEPRPVVWSEHPGWDAATCDADAELIGYYRTAAPVLAREIEWLQGQVETRDIIIYQVAWQMQAVATALGMTPEEQAASAEGIGDAIAERVTRLQAERDAALVEVQRLQAEVQRLQAEVERLRGPHRHCYHCLEDLPQGATDDCCDGCREQLRRDEEAE